MKSHPMEGIHHFILFTWFHTARVQGPLHRPCKSNSLTPDTILQQLVSLISQILQQKGILRRLDAPSAISLPKNVLNRSL